MSVGSRNSSKSFSPRGGDCFSCARYLKTSESSFQASPDSGGGADLSELQALTAMSDAITNVVNTLRSSCIEASSAEKSDGENEDSLSSRCLGRAMRKRTA